MLLLQIVLFWGFVCAYHDLYEYDIDASIIKPGKITEWTPVSSNITAGTSDYFVFPVASPTLSDGNWTFLLDYETLIFISGNVCSKLSNLSDVTLNVYYGFNENITSDLSLASVVQFESGYVEALAIVPQQDAISSGNSSSYSSLYVVVQLVNSTTGSPLSTDASNVWEYNLGISENDLVYQWDWRTWLEVEDTDHQSALLSVGNSSAMSTPSASGSFELDLQLYDLYVYTYEDDLQFNDMSLSLCALKHGPYIVNSVDLQNSNSITNTTTDVQLDLQELAVQKIIHGTNTTTLNNQFYVTGLNSSSTYVAYLIKRVGALSEVGGIRFSKIVFTTKDSDACSLILGLDFCSDVGYSVPTSSMDPTNKTLMATTYDLFAKALYANFTKALQIIPCDAELDAVYSPLRTCDDCATAYRNWVCAVTIPRCQTHNSTYYKYREKTNNRNDYLNTVIQPISDYYEVLPCIDVCNVMVRDCPASFGFACPTMEHTPDLLLNSYNLYYQFSANNLTCNFLGQPSDINVHPLT